ncbi:hypothetical protein [Deinococcus aquaticus]|uniref:hypothetical protein n=1 Tax=Deinococcus aquaticus TaxID=328692 RepID=UPI003F4584C7
MTSFHERTTRPQSLRFRTPGRTRTLSHLIEERASRSGTLEQLRSAQVELLNLGIHPAESTVTVSGGVEVLLRQPRSHPVALVAFVIRGRTLRSVGSAVLLTRVAETMDRTLLTLMFAGAQAGDQVVVIGGQLNEGRWTFSASGVHRVFTLT